MTEEKIDQVLNGLGAIKGDIGSIKEDVNSLKEGLQKNYDLIQKNGVRLEKLASDIKAVAEVHSILDRKIETRFNELSEKMDVLPLVVKDISRDLKEHTCQTAPPAHVPI